MHNGLSPLDPNSYSRPDLAVVTAIKFAITVNFERRTFHCTVDVTVKKVDPSVNEVVLDVKDLEFQSVYEKNLGRDLDYHISEPVPNFGSRLTIQLPPKEDGTYIINFRYETSPKASGLQWLTPEQTAGKELPFVFSEFQTCHARSVLPCQDTPCVKVPYTALVIVPKGFTAVMSSPRQMPKESTDSVMFLFCQKVPIPSYLIAIAVGALESREIGPRSHVWGEKEIIEAAAYEFADTEKMLQIAEELYGPYMWGIYDLLVLPPSFPYGGMENPCMTFVTPTLLAGDKSFECAIAHEICHGWSGNLVTHKNFHHYWLNEGFAVFMERKIIGYLQSLQERDFQAYCGTTELRETIEELGNNNPLTALVLNIPDVDPDECLTKVPYEKGHIFLRYIEVLVGGPSVFEAFLRSYFETFKFKSIDTLEFKSYFENFFADNHCINQIDWDAWLYGPGMPPIIPAFDDTLMEVCTAFKQRWVEWEEDVEKAPITRKDVATLMSTQIIQLLREIFAEPPQSIEKLRKIEKIFRFDANNNAEIKFKWLRIGLKARWEEKIEPAIAWINEIGRLKFVRPLYQDLYSWDESRDRAVENYLQHRHEMMHVGAYIIGKDLDFRL